jgi:hypothetical protein
MDNVVVVVVVVVPSFCCYPQTLNIIFRVVIEEREYKCKNPRQVASLQSRSNMAWTIRQHDNFSNNTNKFHFFLMHAMGTCWLMSRDTHMEMATHKHERHIMTFIRPR